MLHYFMLDQYYKIIIHTLQVLAYTIGALLMAKAGIDAMNDWHDPKTLSTALWCIGTGIILSIWYISLKILSKWGGV